MAFDLKKLKQGMQKSADNLRKTVSDASEKFPESVKDINVADSFKDISQKGQSAFATLKSKGKEVVSQQKEKKALKKEAVSGAMQQKDGQELMISIRDSLRLICCMMIIDGKVSDEEKMNLFEIGYELDPHFSSYQEELLEEGIYLMNLPSEDEDDYYDNIHNHVSDIIHSSSLAQDNGICGKVLLWDLLTVAYSDGEYSSSEKRLLRYIAKSVGVDYAILLEMEHTVRTLLAIETEEAWLKNTNRSYAVVEERVNELTDRKKTIMVGVRELLAD